MIGSFTGDGAYHLESIYTGVAERLPDASSRGSLGTRPCGRRHNGPRFSATTLVRTEILMATAILRRAAVATAAAALLGLTGGAGGATKRATRDERRWSCDAVSVTPSP